MSAISRSLPPLLLLGFAAGLSTNCATRGIAIGECREIETARCQASANCGQIDKTDVDACVRFYRDQCLHGIAGPEPPTEKAQDACVHAIEQAGACAKTDRDMTTVDCDAGGGAGGAGGTGTSAVAVCEFVSEPWNDPVCDFLLPAPDGGEGGKS